MRVALTTIGDHDLSRFYALQVWDGDKPILEGVATADAPKSISPGSYRMARDRTGRHQWWSIQHVEGRTALEFHSGNWGLRDSEGCILPGSAIRWMRTQAGLRFLGVTESIATLNEMKLVLGEGEHELTIS